MSSESDRSREIEPVLTSIVGRQSFRLLSVPPDLRRRVLDGWLCSKVDSGRRVLHPWVIPATDT